MNSVKHSHRPATPLLLIVLVEVDALSIQKSGKIIEKHVSSASERLGNRLGKRLQGEGATAQSHAGMAVSRVPRTEGGCVGSDTGELVGTRILEDMEARTQGLDFDKQ